MKNMQNSFSVANLLYHIYQLKLKNKAIDDLDQLILQTRPARGKTTRSSERFSRLFGGMGLFKDDKGIWGSQIEIVVAYNVPNDSSLYSQLWHLLARQSRQTPAPCPLTPIVRCENFL